MSRIHVVTQGCTSNHRESEIMMGLLKDSGNEICDDEKHADIEIVNVCTVKGDTTALREIRKRKRERPDTKIIVAGCITNSLVPKVKELDDTASFVNTHNFGSISTVVDTVSDGESVSLLDKKYEPKVGLPSVRKNPVVGITPILNSCNYGCTYCSTKLIKGRLVSYPMDLIREDVKNHLKDGCKEIWITSQDTGAYMLDQGGKQKLIELLDMLLSIPMDYKLRLGMMNPGNTVAMLDELIRVYKHAKMFKFLHVPVQSGNDDVLKAMNRQYGVSTYYDIVDAFRREIPDITISTDIICGFPGETEKQFEDSLEMLRRSRPDVMNISGFASREGTVASRMENHIVSREIKERTRAMTQVKEEISRENNKKWLGRRCTIIIDEIGKHNTFVGRNESYKPVIVSGDFTLGQEVVVEITETTTFDLRGRVV